MKISTFAVAAALAASLGLAGCAAGTGTPGGSSSHGADHGSPSATSSTMPEANADHNQADLTFAQMMIPHHAQAVEMSDIVLAKPDLPAEVAALATRIKDAQAPEIEAMTGWLKSWNVPVAVSDHSGEGMAGMVDAEGIDKLKAAQGAEAARLFMDQMTGHHEGAVEMAQQEISAGKHPQAVQLARDIVTAQEAEIAEMKQLLAGL
ncbi:DUF305 domain-containing protein [Pseudarthrobacter sp. R1]|uniref:DUF305 domain-containing protein n=1 Tax=Pseudarthrobacter sp. R1 TaxID=2944934 RepID=UPI00210B424C|nr:DUF305 domain-containing protein [Pseudarthrobacter sp. R1]MCQ6273205.1 DUF305 domain-containing protein [Pseudarthrobacter sp. R1]